MMVYFSDELSYDFSIHPFLEKLIIAVPNNNKIKSIEKLTNLKNLILVCNGNIDIEFRKLTNLEKLLVKSNYGTNNIDDNESIKFNCGENNEIILPNKLNKLSEHCVVNANYSLENIDPEYLSISRHRSNISINHMKSLKFLIAENSTFLNQSHINFLNLTVLEIPGVENIHELVL